MISKEQIKISLDNLPDKVTVDQVIDRLLYLEKIQKGLEESKNGQVNTKDEAKRKLNRWIK